MSEKDKIDITLERWQWSYLTALLFCRFGPDRDDLPSDWNTANDIHRVIDHALYVEHKDATRLYPPPPPHPPTT